MRLTIFTWAFGAFTVVLAAACGGDHSGVDAGKTASALTDDDATTFCAWAVDKLGGEGSVAPCEAGTGTKAPTKQECVSNVQTLKNQSCAATVAQMEECVKAEAEDRCAASRPTACAAVDACAKK
jgi:hypothetical protein